MPRTPRRTPQTPFDAQATYEVCAIEAKRRKRGNTEYLVLWKDCPPSDNTWEPLENLQGSEQLVNQFEKEWQANYDAAEAQASQDRERRRQMRNNLKLKHKRDQTARLIKLKT